MATVLDETPRFQECVAAASLIVVGRVSSAASTTVDRTGERARVQTDFLVDVEQRIKGDCPDRVSVRVVGGSTEGVATPWTATMEEGARALLLLAPDYGPDHPSDRFVPYFGNVFSAGVSGGVEVDPELARDLEDLKTPMKGLEVNLADMVRQIATLEQVRELEERDAAKAEPAEFRDAPTMEHEGVEESLAIDGVSAEPEPAAESS